MADDQTLLTPQQLAPLQHADKIIRRDARLAANQATLRITAGDWTTVEAYVESLVRDQMAQAWDDAVGFVAQTALVGTVGLNVECWQGNPYRADPSRAPEPTTTDDTRVRDREGCTWAPGDGAWWHICSRACRTAEQGPNFNTKVGRVLGWDELVAAYGPVEVQP